MLGFSKRKDPKNYDLFSGFSYFVPNINGLIAVLLIFIGGALLANVLAAGMMILGMGDYSMLVSYPVMFLPAMMYAQYQSRSNALFNSGIAINSTHTGRTNVLVMALLLMLSTLALSYLMDMVNVMMPPMPEWLDAIMANMTQGKLWMNFLSVSIFAPFFEEWLCRGIVLRGLLNYKRLTGDRFGIRPVWAIVISAAFFAIIHMNPWQAVPAFVLGCLFGYVYYRTGSLLFTMLMHFTNNTLALVVGQIDSLKDADTWFDVLSVPEYASIAVIAVVALAFTIWKLNKIELIRPQGNCDVVSE